MKNIFTLASLAIFTICSLAIALYTDVYYSNSRTLASTDVQEDDAKAQLVIPEQSIKRILLNNRIAKLDFLKNLDSWLLLEKTKHGTIRKLPVKESKVKEILSFLDKIKVNETIKPIESNLRNLSITNPLYEVSFENQKKKNFHFKVGVNNSLDNSSYFYFNRLDQIIKSTPMQVDLANLSASNFLSNHIFNLTEKNINHVELKEHLNKEKTKSITKISKKDKSWTNDKNTIIDSNRLENALSELQNIKSHLILEENDLPITNQEEKDKFLTPIMSLNFKSTDNENYDFTFLKLKKDISSLKIKRKESLLVKSSLHNSIFVIEKNEIKRLQALKTRKLRQIDLKKIIY